MYDVAGTAREESLCCGWKLIEAFMVWGKHEVEVNWKLGLRSESAQCPRRAKFVRDIIAELVGNEVF